ncbi:MAG: Gfo/Idh/MocA family oxidoreductase [Clostridiales bacterium]|nr:Gfo/Idh/MocA family oxidoreductase [Clostridiales bacterium]
MESLGVAIIGCGSVHHVHVDAIKNNGMGRILWFVDSEEERAKSSAQKYGGKWCTNYSKALEDPKLDLVHICTPHYLHAQMAIDAVNAGKHAFVEKPAATNLEAAKLMAESAKKNNKLIVICFQNRYNPTSLKAKEIIDSGELGKIKGVKGLVTWFRDSDYYTLSGWRGSFDTEGGGVLINQAIHTLDLMQWLVGEVEHIEGNVSTRALKGVIDVEDTADATLYFKNGARGIFYATNCYTDNSPIELEIHMEKGKLRISSGELIRIDDGEHKVLVNENSEQSPYKSYWGKSHDIAIRKFYECLKQNSKTDIIPLDDGLEALKIVDGIYKSSSTGKKIKIN